MDNGRAALGFDDVGGCATKCQAVTLCPVPVFRLACACLLADVIGSPAASGGLGVLVFAGARHAMAPRLGGLLAAVVQHVAGCTWAACIRLLLSGRRLGRSSRLTVVEFSCMFRVVSTLGTSLTYQRHSHLYQNKYH